MRLWIGIHLPRLPLDVFSPRWSTEQACAVLEQERVLAANPAARAAGIVPGLRRGGAHMLLPELRLEERSLALEAQALQAVAMAMLQYTPLVTEAEDASLLMEVGASLRLFGGVRALCRRLRADLRALGFSATLSCAPSARGAWLLARHKAGRVLKMSTLERRLHGVPCILLPPLRPYQQWLEGIGCFSLGELRRLPRAGLQRRCGAAVLEMLDAAHGMAPEMFNWIEPPETFRTHLELFGRIENTELLLAGAHRLLLQMIGWLCARQLAVERISLALEHERGRYACPPTVLEITLAEPVWHEHHLLRLLREKLGRLDLPSPAIGLWLEALQVQAMEPPSADLFPDPGGNADEQKRMLEVLAARLGEQNVLQAAPQADYRPEQANAWVPLSQALRKGDVQLPPDVHSLPRPAWLLRAPIALVMRDHRPIFETPLKMVSAPERIEVGWWNGVEARDYFIAQGADLSYYWVFRERMAPGLEPRWFVQGLFP